MNRKHCISIDTLSGSVSRNSESGFSLLEFLISAALLLVISIPLFGALNEIQGTAAYQNEIHAVLDNTRIALQEVERRIRQAGNDPHRIGFDGIDIISSTEVRVRTDLTGSAGYSDSDKGDPDGDINDSGENLVIRYNTDRRRLEMISRNGPPQIIADNISGFSMRYFDADGNETGIGNRVRKISVTISASSPCKDPRTGERFGVQRTGTFRILT